MNQRRRISPSDDAGLDSATGSIPKSAGDVLALECDSVESLVFNAAVITALLMSFVVSNIIGNFNADSFDRSTFRQCLYSWPNRDFQEYLVWTLEQEGVNTMIELDRDVTFDLTEKIRNLPVKEKLWPNGQTPDHETIVELLYPVLPIHKFRAWLVQHVWWQESELKSARLCAQVYCS